MSKEKVELYKKEKANRKQTIKKEKLKTAITRTIGTILCIALLGWIGYSGYNMWTSSRPAKTTEVTTDALTDYIDGLNTEE